MILARFAHYGHLPPAPPPGGGGGFVTALSCAAAFLLDEGLKTCGSMLRNMDSLKKQHQTKGCAKPKGFANKATEL
jgi:hypothetical protein